MTLLAAGATTAELIASRSQYDVTGKAPASGEHGEEEQRQRCHHPASVAKRTQGSNEAACMTIAPTPSLRPHGLSSSVPPQGGSGASKRHADIHHEVTNLPGKGGLRENARFLRSSLSRLDSCSA
uniref:Uncharacterized protein n=1 Tax=Oryza sativa subsp. japonica TaxID=39947 RepID=Q6YX50_ORYSJ|nr:hypothetical protein [Oryza sativa Japonica Group]